VFGGTAMAAAVIAGRSAVVSALRSAGAGPYTPLTGAASSTRKGHTHYVCALAVLPDGRLASASYDKTIRVWRLSTGVCEAVMEGHTDWVYALAVLPDGRARIGERGQYRACVAHLDRRVRGRAGGAHGHGACPHRAPRRAARIGKRGHDRSCVVVADRILAVHICKPVNTVIPLAPECGTTHSTLPSFHCPAGGVESQPQRRLPPCPCSDHGS